tara:strand:+ start:3047 stop:3490 length:444 start_codon:yes stop_codon:yes gene_type:complete
MFQLFGLFGSFLSASSAIKEGKERRRQYEQEAKELELERTQTEIKGLESHNLRLAAFDEANNMNSALFGFANRDETADRSIRAFKKKQKEVASQDVKTSDMQTRFASLKLTRASAEAKRKGFAAEQAARTKAMSTLFSGINNYSKVS